MDSSFEKSHGGIDSMKETTQTQRLCITIWGTWESAANKWNLKQNNMTCRSRKKTQPEISVRILIILKCKLMLILGVLLGFYALILGSCSYIHISGNYVAGNL